MGQKDIGQVGILKVRSWHAPTYNYGMKSVNKLTSLKPWKYVARGYIPDMYTHTSEWKRDRKLYGMHVVATQTLTMQLDSGMLGLKR